MQITSKIDRITLFSRGAEITRLAEIVLCEGEHEITLNDLPVGLVDNSLRVEGEADGMLELGAVDSRSVHIPVKSKALDEKGRRQLEKQIEKLEDEGLEIDGRLQTAQTQKNLMDNLAMMPMREGSASSHETNWGAIFDLIGDRLPRAHTELNALTIERRELQERIDDLRGQLADKPPTPLRRTEVKLSAKAYEGLRGFLTIRYQMPDAGWQPLYDARLETGDQEREPLIDLVRRAQIHQNSAESWDDVVLTLSTTRPTGGTSAPDLLAEILDILPDHPPVPLARALLKQPMVAAAPVGAFEDEMVGAVPQAEMMEEAVEMQSHTEQTSFAASFKVPGRVSLTGKGAQKKVRLGAQVLTPRLEIRSTPLLDPTSYLHADFKLENGVALLPGQIALYRDNVFVGNGQLPLVNVGENHELGFGADDAVIIKRVEIMRSRGKHGLIKTENTDEFHFRITINNHHTRMMPVRILDRIPASNHEKLRVERLKDMSTPTLTDVDDKRGVLVFENKVAAGAEEVINIHYRVSWPRDERIG